MEGGFPSVEERAIRRLNQKVGRINNGVFPHLPFSGYRKDTVAIAIQFCHDNCLA